MSYLLDKVTARSIVRTLFKRSQKQTLTPEEIFTYDLFRRILPERLFIVPASANVLQLMAQSPLYSPVIHLFLSHVEVVIPGPYFKRWARRLRGYAFTREDAAVLALGTFGTDETNSILGMNIVATLDQPMINNWTAREAELEKRLDTMRRNLAAPYNQASLPQVLRPEEIVP
ncbi:MAG: hypothetical protein ACPGWR_11975 [Ardenticatenaceae bacterium]